MNEADHTRYSELLGDYVRAQLPAAEAEALELHLQTCEECRAETAALHALAVEPEPLSELERARLRSQVVSARSPAPRRRSFWGRVAPALSAAALIVLVAIGVYQGFSSRGGGDDTADTAAPRPAAEGGGAGQDAATGLESTVEAKDATASTLRATASQPEFALAAGSFTLDDLRRFGRDSDLFKGFTGYTVSDARRNRGKFLARLEKLAPASQIRAQVQECADQVFAGVDSPLLPAYGAIGSLVQNKSEEPALVLGFAYVREGSGPLNAFQLWVWPRGDCDSPIGYTAAKIRP
jgi:hypothetical protein